MICYQSNSRLWLTEKQNILNDVIALLDSRFLFKHNDKLIQRKQEGKGKLQKPYKQISAQMS